MYIMASKEIKKGIWASAEKFHRRQMCLTEKTFIQL